MKSAPLDLGILGMGAISPAGVGLTPLLESVPFPVTQEKTMGPGSRQWPVARINMRDEWAERWQKEPRLRRASPISYFLVEAASQALGLHMDIPRPRIGLVGAFFTGSIVYSRRFYTDIVNKGHGHASPALFPETVFNSPLSHVASVLGLAGYSYTLVGDETAWVTALQVASTWIKLDQVDAVMVVAAEELDVISLEAYDRAGWMKGDRPILPAEGAGAFLVGKAPASGGDLISAAEGFPYRSFDQADSSAREAVACFPEDNQVWPSAGGGWLAPLENRLYGSRLVPDVKALAKGHAFAASAAWRTIQAVSLSSSTASVVLPIWGSNQQISALQLRGRKAKGSCA